MAHYQKIRVKLTKIQLHKLKPAAKKKTGAILKANKKNVQDKELPHELFLITRQTFEIRNAFAKNMSIDAKASNSQISKITQSGGSFGSCLANLGNKNTSNVALSLIMYNLPRLVSNLEILR